MSMTSTSGTAVFPELSAEASTRPDRDARVLRASHWLVLSVWCGLVAGTLEVVTIVTRKSLVDLNHFYWISRHFVWLIPLTNMGVFLAIGAVLALLVLCCPRRGSEPAALLLCALTVL
jgi:hypothetical protein